MMSGDGEKYSSKNVYNGFFWEKFVPFLKRNRYTIFFGLVGIAIGYYCDTPVIHFIKHITHKSTIELEALEGVYFVISGIVGGGISAVVTHCIRRWMYPTNIVDFSNCEE